MNLPRLKSVLVAKDGDHLGDLVFWTLADARVDRTTLEAFWNGAGLDVVVTDTRRDRGRRQRRPPNRSGYAGAFSSLTAASWPHALHFAKRPRACLREPQFGNRRQSVAVAARAATCSGVRGARLRPWCERASGKRYEV
jgi:hypothetical protein